MKTKMTMIFILSILLLGCTGGRVYKTNPDNFIGMTKNEIRSVYGNPQQTMTKYGKDGNSDVWIYSAVQWNQPRNTEIMFDRDNKAVSINKTGGNY